MSPISSRGAAPPPTHRQGAVTFAGEPVHRAHHLLGRLLGQIGHLQQYLGRPLDGGEPLVPALYLGLGVLADRIEGHESVLPVGAPVHVRQVVLQVMEDGWRSWSARRC